MKIRKIIVTGPTGAVGTALIEEAIKRNMKIANLIRQNIELGKIKEFGC